MRIEKLIPLEKFVIEHIELPAKLLAISYEVIKATSINHAKRKKPERSVVIISVEKEHRRVSLKQYSLDQSCLMRQNVLGFMWAQEGARNLQLYPHHSSDRPGSL